MTQLTPIPHLTIERSVSRPMQRAQNSFAGSLGRLGAAAMNWATRLWIQHRDEKLLQSLTDHQLDDLGISRGQIPRVLRDGWDR